MDSLETGALIPGEKREKGKRWGLFWARDMVVVYFLGAAGGGWVLE